MEKYLLIDGKRQLNGDIGLFIDLIENISKSDMERYIKKTDIGENDMLVTACY